MDCRSGGCVPGLHGTAAAGLAVRHLGLLRRDQTKAGMVAPGRPRVYVGRRRQVRVLRPPVPEAEQGGCPGDQQVLSAGPVLRAS